MHHEANYLRKHEWGARNFTAVFQGKRKTKPISQQFHQRRQNGRLFPSSSINHKSKGM
jgi:hypothetical protein